jgi:hypothetical protein
MRLEVPRGVGWRLIEMGMSLKHCNRLLFDEDGDPILNCALAVNSTLIHIPKRLWRI